jgi:uncharacterized protein (TIGR02145 family)
MKKLFALIVFVGSSILFTLFAQNIGRQSIKISDIEGNSYNTVLIGNQHWMAENLKVSKYNDGTQIPNVTDDTKWSGLSSGAWCYYNNEVVNNSKYGKLYNWYAISLTTNGNKNLCPSGWHVPSDIEWTVLIKYLGGEDVAGGKLKGVGTTNWSYSNTDDSNISLFTGLPGGNRNDAGSFENIGEGAYWWSSSEVFWKSEATGMAWYRYLFSSIEYRKKTNQVNGLSIRCIRD